MLIQEKVLLDGITVCHHKKETMCLTLVSFSTFILQIHTLNSHISANVHMSVISNDCSS